MNVLQVQRQTVAINNALLLESGGQRGTRSIEFPIAHSPIEVVHCCLLRHSLHCLKKHLKPPGKSWCDLGLHIARIMLEPGTHFVCCSSTHCFKRRIIFHQDPPAERETDDTDLSLRSG